MSKKPKMSNRARVAMQCSNTTKKLLDVMDAVTGGNTLGVRECVALISESQMDLQVIQHLLKKIDGGEG